MVQIMTDSSATMTVAQGQEINVIINPLSVTIDDKTYIEMEEIQSEEFLEIIAQGHLPHSSQPSIGQTLDHYEKNFDKQLINIAMADGLSGTYQSSVAALKLLDENNQKNITVIDSKTLWAPLGYIVKKANKVAQEGKTVEEIIDAITPCLENNGAFFIPNDFDYLKRNGRLTPLAANVGEMLKLVPIMTQSKDRKKIEKFAICRNFKMACQSIIKYYKKININSDYILYVSHSNVPKSAELLKSQLIEAFPDVEIQMFSLSPIMITQGGPGNVAVQYILK